MYSKSGKVIIAFIVIVELCSCSVPKSFVPLKRDSPFINFGARTAPQRSIAENYVGPRIDESAVSSQDKVGLQSVGLQSVGLQSVSPRNNALSYSDVSSNEKYAERGDFTYQVSIQQNYGYPYCTGALLSDRWVLSSGQCANGMQVEDFLIVVGALFTGEGDIYICETIKIHENFNPATLENDIALFSTNKPILFHQYVQPIPYHKGTIKACDAEKVVVGYRYNYGAYMSNYNEYLSYLNVSVISNEECQVVLTNIGSPERYFTTSVCVMANVFNYETLMCTGSGVGGQPLASSARVLLGIKSVQINCDGNTGNTPFMFTGVSSFAEWIAANTNSSDAYGNYQQ